MPVRTGPGYKGSYAKRRDNSQRKAARYALEQDGIVREHDGKDVHHKRDISAGGTNARSNLAVTSVKTNRAHWKGKKR